MARGGHCSLIFWEETKGGHKEVREICSRRGGDGKASGVGEEIRGRSRRELVVRGRKVFCQVAFRKLGYTGASVARFLGMTTSSVNRMGRLEEMMEVDAWGK